MAGTWAVAPQPSSGTETPGVIFAATQTVHASDQQTPRRGSVVHVVVCG